AWLDSKTVLSDASLDDATSLGDIQWSGVGASRRHVLQWLWHLDQPRAPGGDPPGTYQRWIQAIGHRGGGSMLGDDHRMAAENIERALSDLGDPATKSYIGRTVIESYWGAAFHWIAYGCDRKHGKHKENHSKLVSFLRDLGEGAVSNLWDNREKSRSGGW